MTSSKSGREYLINPAPDHGTHTLDPRNPCAQSLSLLRFHALDILHLAVLLLLLDVGHDALAVAAVRAAVVVVVVGGGQRGEVGHRAREAVEADPGVRVAAEGVGRRRHVDALALHLDGVLGDGPHVAVGVDGAEERDRQAVDYDGEEHDEVYH